MFISINWVKVNSYKQHSSDKAPDKQGTHKTISVIYASKRMLHFGAKQQKISPIITITKDTINVLNLCIIFAFFFFIHQGPVVQT